MRHAPPHEGYPEVRHQEHHEQNSVDVLVETTDGAQDEYALVTHDQDDHGSGYVEAYRVVGRPGCPAERYSAWCGGKCLLFLGRGF